MKLNAEQMVNSKRVTVFCQHLIYTMAPKGTVVTWFMLLYSLSSLSFIGWEGKIIPAFLFCNGGHIFEDASYETKAIKAGWIISGTQLSLLQGSKFNFFMARPSWPWHKENFGAPRQVGRASRPTFLSRAGQQGLYFFIKFSVLFY